MKTIISSMLMILGFYISSHAQTVDRKWNLGLMVGTSEYAGDLGNGFIDFNTKALDNNRIVGLSLNRFMSTTFDFSLMGVFGDWGYYKTAEPFKGEMILGSAFIKFKFDNGYIIKEESRLSPYLLFGAGFTRLRGDKINGGLDYPIMAGAGLNLRISEVMGLNYQATYGYLSSDGRDYRVGGTLYDAFLLHSIGLNFSLGHKADADEDGISDKNDKCPNTPVTVKVDNLGCPVDGDGDGIADHEDMCPNAPGLVATKGCPDADKDDVADKDDQCPNEPGLATLKGCPDTDNDGIIDSKDKCPNIKGVLAMEGCPDKDGDGIEDEKDKCPDVSGVALFQGCPDSDSDGIQDMNDMCPNLKGLPATNGCPDTDNDGVHDGIDKCPTLAGIATNAGCPEIKKETRQLFQKALQGIQFETGKAVIKPVSFPILNAVYNVMNENPTYKLLIGGHTDNVGSDEVNLTLSQNRADAVAKYLITKGISPLRVSATGYGESRPANTNANAAGRARNRRVELEVEFIEVVK
ncbi:MAG: OmpA family protein [Bacteroidota bacterium]|nr:OmpA family protein [Bacteroidota bacterium]